MSLTKSKLQNKATVIHFNLQSCTNNKYIGPHLWTVCTAKNVARPFPGEPRHWSIRTRMWICGAAVQVQLYSFNSAHTCRTAKYGIFMNYTCIFPYHDSWTQICACFYTWLINVPTFSLNLNDILCRSLFDSTLLSSCRYVVPPRAWGHLQGGLESAGKPQAPDHAAWQPGVHSGRHQDRASQPGPGADGENCQPGDRLPLFLTPQIDRKLKL